MSLTSVPALVPARGRRGPIELRAYCRAMAQENVEILRRANATFNRGDVEGFLAFCSEDVEIEDLNHAPDLPPVVRGKDAARHVFAAWMNTFNDFIGEIEEYIDVDDRHVGCLVHYRGKARGSGLEVDFRGVDLWEVRGGKLVRGTLGYADRQSALEAVSG
jgi:ketosteroid isomerase-like protein